MTNPVNERITNEEWRCWEECKNIIPGVRLGGIYANKPGYHNTRAANSKTNYSTILTLDKLGPSDKSAAIDLTMSDAEMRKRTRYLRDSALDPEDDRLDGMREFYGTLDGKTVYGLIHDSLTGKWRRSTADSTHLWHIHGSWFRALVQVWEHFEKFLSAISGETWAAWKARKEIDMSILGLKLGDTGERVRYLQYKLGAAGHDVKPDGDYGPATALQVRNCRRAAGSEAADDPVTGPKSGDSITAATAIQIDTQFAKAFAGKDGVGTGSTVTIVGTGTIT